MSLCVYILARYSFPIAEPAFDTCQQHLNVEPASWLAQARLGARCNVRVHFAGK
jgi:hypothetical protein